MKKQPWFIQYAPTSVRDIIGQTSAVSKLSTWLKSWKNRPPKHRAVFLSGGPGTGKTLAVHLLAKELDYDLVELNSTDLRNKTQVKEIVSAASDQATLFGYDRFRIIFFDEVEGLSGRYDRGGLQALTEIVKTSSNPIVITSSGGDPYKFRTLRRYSEQIKFQKIRAPSILKVLKRISQGEGVTVNQEVLDRIVEVANGDLRSAINDLQKFQSNHEVTTKELSALVVSRDVEYEVIPTLEGIFKARSIKEAMFALRSSSVDYNMVLRWLSENIPRVIKHDIEREGAYTALSMASLFLARIRRRQSWNLLPYALELMSAGVALNQLEAPRGWLRFQFPLWLGKLSRRKGQVTSVKDIQNTIRTKVHASQRELTRTVIPFLRLLMKEDKALAKAIVLDLGLNQEQTDFIAGGSLFKKLFK
jgi:replication factor C large subunit